MNRPMLYDHSLGNSTKPFIYGVVIETENRNLRVWLCDDEKNKHYSTDGTISTVRKYDEINQHLTLELDLSKIPQSTYTLRGEDPSDGKLNKSKWKNIYAKVCTLYDSYRLVSFNKNISVDLLSFDNSRNALVVLSN